MLKQLRRGVSTCFLRNNGHGLEHWTKPPQEKQLGDSTLRVQKSVWNSVITDLMMMLQHGSSIISNDFPSKQWHDANRETTACQGAADPHGRPCQWNGASCFSIESGRCSRSSASTFSELWEAPKVCWSAYFSRPTWRRRIHDFGGFNMFQPHMCSYLYMKRMTILNPNIWNIMMELSEDTGKS